MLHILSPNFLSIVPIQAAVAPSLHRRLDQAELGDRVVPEVGDVQHRVLVEVIVEHDARGPPQRAVQLHDAEWFPLLAE